MEEGPRQPQDKQPVARTRSNSQVVDELCRRFSGHSLFQIGDKRLIETLVNTLQPRVYNPGDLIIRFGDVGRALFVVYKGLVEVLSHDGETVIGTLGEGKFFGEVGLLFQVPRIATVRASTRSHLFALTRDKLEMLVEQFPELKELIILEAEERFAIYRKTKGGMNGNEGYSQSPQSLVKPFAAGQLRTNLKKVEMFRECEVGFLHMLAMTLTPKSYREGQYIAKSGEIGSSMYFISTGCVEVLEGDQDKPVLMSNESAPNLKPTSAASSLNTTSGDVKNKRPSLKHMGKSDVSAKPSRRVYATLYPGDFFGEISILFRLSRIASVMAKTNCELFELSKDSLDEILESYPEMKKKVEETGKQRISKYKSNLKRGKKTAEGKEEAVVDHFDIKRSERGVMDTADSGASVANEGLAQQNGSPISSEPNASKMVLRNPKVTELITKSTRKRRGSVAVWSNLDELLDGVSSVLSEDGGNNVDNSGESVMDALDNQIVEIEGISYSSDDFADMCAYRTGQKLPKHMVLSNSDLMHSIFSWLDMADRCVMGLVCRKWRFCILKYYLKRGLSLSGPRVHKLVTDDAVVHLISCIINNLSNPNAYKMISPLQSPRSPRHNSAGSVDGSVSPITVNNVNSVNNVDNDIGIVSSVNKSQSGRKSPLHIQIPQEPQFQPKPKSPTALVANNSSTRLIPKSPRLKPAFTPILTEIDLKNCWRITDRGVAGIAETCPSLHKLSLFSCWEVTSHGVIAVADACRYLREVNLSNCRKVTDHAIVALTTSYIALNMEYSFIRILELSYCKNLTELSIEHISKHCSKLTHLNLQRCTGISNAGFLSFTKSPPLLFLKHLNLSDCMILNDAGLESVLKSIPNVEHLDLSFCSSLTDNCFSSFSELKKLKHLSLGGCGNASTDAGMALLFKDDMPHLKSLNLRNASQLTDKGLETILEHSSLSVLDLRYCKKISLQSLVECQKRVAKVYLDAPTTPQSRRTIIGSPNIISPKLVSAERNKSL
eukprot:Nk52_evm8s280 gene=Nk52_evmTU8s280